MIAIDSVLWSTSFNDIFTPKTDSSLATIMAKSVSLGVCGFKTSRTILLIPNA